MTRRERLERDRRIVAAKRRGVSASAIADEHGLTRQRVNQIVVEWEDVPSISGDGVVVDAMEEIDKLIAAHEQAIEDLGVLVGDDQEHGHVKLAAIRLALDAWVRRVEIMASAGRLPPQLAAPAVEQECAAMVAALIDVVRKHSLPEKVVQDMMAAAASRMCRAVPETIEARAA